MNEILDFINKSDTRRQIIGDIREKEQKIKELPLMCGSCELWMTSQCQREKTKKVTMSMPVCRDFKQQKVITDLISKLQIEVSEFKKQLSINLPSKDTEG